MNKIPSFQKNHNALLPGFYFSTLQQGVATFDLRFKQPNCGDYLSPAVSHSIEHMIATAIRNGSAKDNIIYFGPMGCRTGFYLLTVHLPPAQALRCLKEAARAALLMPAVPGAKKIECGNYKSHDLPGAKRELQLYLQLLESLTDAQIARQEALYEAAL